MRGGRSAEATCAADGPARRPAVPGSFPSFAEDGGVIVEHAVLDVRPGEEQAFEAAFAQAKGIIAASPGFQALRLARCIERSSRYLLLVEWETLEAHTTGFRGSPAFEEWRRLLHHFYEPFPVVEHFEGVVTIG